MRNAYDSEAREYDDRKETRYQHYATSAKDDMGMRYIQYSKQAISCFQLNNLYSICTFFFNCIDCNLKPKGAQRQYLQTIKLSEQQFLNYRNPQ